MLRLYQTININKTCSVKTTLLMGFFLWITHPLAYTQNRPNEYTMMQDLTKANAFIASYRNDSAHIIVAQLMEEVKKQNQLDSRFGLKVQLAQGTALEHADHDSLAMEILLHVKEQSSEKKLWDIYTQSCISLALLHENMERSSQSLANLQQAQYAISHYGQDSLYPAFAVRMSSYYRVFARNRDSSLFYAQEALRTAPKFKLDLSEAHAHMLTSFLLKKTSYEKALEHCFAALRIFQKLEDYPESAAMYHSISRLHYQYNKTKLALVFNDSAIIEAKKAVTAGFERTSMLYVAYEFRGIQLKSLGQTDSAWYYMNEGHALKLDWVKKSENHKVIEVDARYNDEKKVKKIEQQAQQRNGLLAIGFLIILFAAILTYYYLKLRRANLITQEQEAQLRMLDVAKSRFFANISHELRTPLTLVLGPIHTLLKENQLADKQLNLLQIAKRNGKQLQLLVNEILDLRKLEMGKMTLVQEPTELSSFFNRYVSQFESLAQNNLIDFSIELLADKNLVVQIDREKYRQILYNLLSNAFKFTQKGGKIKVIQTVNKNRLLLEVRDSGSGIHPKDLPHVFDRFFQSNRPDRPAEGGTGIGLALCKEYAQLFGGSIHAESKRGKGSIFKVTFPVSVVEDSQLPIAHLQEIDTMSYPPPQQKKGALSLSHIPKLTLLVVEDNPELQAYIRLVLEEKYQIITADNGKMALDVLKDDKGGPSVNLIISDLMMPVMDGFQLLEKLKSEDATRHIPVIMLTARAETTDKLKALRIGVDDYITKPFDEEELMIRIENLLKNKAVRENESLSDIEQADSEPIISETDREWLENFEGYVQKNFSSDILSVSKLAEVFYMSESSLLRQLKRLTGLTAMQYLQEIRLNEARHLLENRDSNSIAQVASKVGYSDTRHFSRRFKQRFGKSPSEYFND